MSVKQIADSLETDVNNAADTSFITAYLKSNKLSIEDELAMKTVLVHKYQELQAWEICLNYCHQQVTSAQSRNNKLAEATFYKLIGNTYYYLPDKDKAIEYWKKSIGIGEPENFTELLEQCYHNLGSVYLEKGQRYDWAELYLLKSVELSKENKTTHTPLGNLHLRLLATLYQRTHQLAKAENLFKDVIEKTRLMKDSLNLAQGLMFYTDVLVNQKKYDSAIRYAGEALNISRKINKLDMVQTALEIFSSVLFNAGKYKEAYLAKEELKNISETRYKTDLSGKITEAEAKFKNAETEHEKELAILRAKKEKQFWISGLLITFTCIALLFYIFYQRRNARQKLQMLAQMQLEKERLSRDLHDNLGSQMTLLSNTIESLDINHKRHEGIDKNIEQVKSSTKQLLQTLRETIWILNKEQLTAQDFFDKLIDYTHRYLQQAGGIQLKVQEEFFQNKILSGNEALQLFRICQEAINNVCKYSGASVLLIAGKIVNAKMEIKIIDSGHGFDANATTGKEHYGLKNMKCRAEEINATLKIISEPKQGTTVTVSI